jgi:predicted RNA-binding protein associated with RNAse of E/G family
MTRQERALLSQQSGLEDSALDLAFSLKNQGMSYDDVTKKADAAKKSQLTQTQAMKALADAIERLVKSGSSGSGGFIDRFIQGFTVGIQRSREFRHGGCLQIHGF